MLQDSNPPSQPCKPCQQPCRTSLSGSLLGFCLLTQVVTGVFLAMHYSPDIELAFASVEHITRDINHGFTLRYWHANGASIYFLCVYSQEYTKCDRCVLSGFYFGTYFMHALVSPFGGDIIDLLFRFCLKTIVRGLFQCFWPSPPTTGSPGAPSSGSGSP